MLSSCCIELHIFVLFFMLFFFVFFYVFLLYLPPNPHAPQFCQPPCEIFDPKVTNPPPQPACEIFKPNFHVRARQPACEIFEPKCSKFHEPQSGPTTPKPTNIQPTQPHPGQPPGVGFRVGGGGGEGGVGTPKTAKNGIFRTSKKSCRFCPIWNRSRFRLFFRPRDFF